MVAQETKPKERAIALLNELPDAAIAEVVSFLEYQRYKLRHEDARPDRTTRYLPTAMGGLEKGTRITADDIAEARREMWGKFSDDEA